jgi:hypothetical protein
MRRFAAVWSIFLVVGILVTRAPVWAQDEGRGLGARPPTPREAAYVNAISIPVARVDPNGLSRQRARVEIAAAAAQGRLLPVNATAPLLADNSTLTYFPPIRSQGSQGSCTCFAACYYWNTYTQAKDEGLNPSGGNNDYISSPAFMYPLVNWGADGGAYTGYVMARLSDIGCCSWTLKPYSSGDYTSWPSEAAWINALNRRTSTPHSVNGYTQSGVDAVKQHLANGDLAVTDFTVYTNFYWYYPSNVTGISNGVYYYPDGSVVGGHAVALVGYDDNKAYIDHRDGQVHYGAFLVANSWGTGWGVYNSTGTGTKGFFWVAYSAFLEGDFGFNVWFNDDRPGYRPTMYAVAGLNHPQRGMLQFNSGFGAGSPPADWISHYTLDMSGGTDLGISDAARVAIDLTDGLGSTGPLGLLTSVGLYVASDAAASGTITSAEFFSDLDHPGVYDHANSVDPTVAVGPGAWGYARAVMPREVWRGGEFDYPYGVSVNPTDGSCWVADYFHNQVVHLAQNGTELWRGGSLNHPVAVSVNPSDGSCWVADEWNGQIVHLAQDGAELSRSGGVQYPFSVSVNPTDGSCWVADTYGTVVHLRQDGTELWRGTGFSYPQSVSVNPTDGSCWVADFFGQVVHLAQNGTELWRGGPVNYPASVSVNPVDGSCWVAVSNSHLVVHLAENGDELWRGSGLDVPWVVSVNPADGSCWVADPISSDQVVHLAQDGTELWRGAGFSGPISVSVNPTDGSCWIADGDQVVHLALQRLMRLIQVGSGQAPPGQVGTAGISLDDASGLAGLQLDMTYNLGRPALLSVSNVRGGPALPADWVVQYSIPAAAVVRIVAYSPTAAELPPGTSGVIAELDFGVDPAASVGETCTLHPQDIILADGAGQPIEPVQGTDGAFTVIPAVDHFAVQVIPAPPEPQGGDLIAPLPFTVRVEARDAGDALVPSYNGTATLSASVGTADPSGITFVSGVWEGTAVIYADLDPDCALTVEDPGVPASGTSNVFALRGKGDPTSDGAVNVLDVMRTVNLVLGNPVPQPPRYEFQYWAANMNRDHSVNVLDIIQIVNKSLGGASVGATANARGTSSLGAGPVALSLVNEEGGTWAMRVSNAIGLAGAQLEIAGGQTDVSAGDLIAAAGWQVHTKRAQGRLRVIAYSPTATGLTTGEGALLRLTGLRGKPRLASVILSDAAGRSMAVR